MQKSERGSHPNAYRSGVSVWSLSILKCFISDTTIFSLRMYKNSLHDIVYFHRRSTQKTLRCFDVIA
eukprot:UN14311